MNSKQISFTQKWSELSEENKYLESEELILRNTFINSKTAPHAVFQNAFEQVNQHKSCKLKWADTDANQPLAVDSGTALE